MYPSSIYGEVLDNIQVVGSNFEIQNSLFNETCFSGIWQSNPVPSFSLNTSKQRDVSEDTSFTQRKCSWEDGGRGQVPVSKFTSPSTSPILLQKNPLYFPLLVEDLRSKLPYNDVTLSEHMCDSFALAVREEENCLVDPVVVQNVKLV